MLLAWAVGPLCAAGTLFTTSHGSQLTLALGAVLLLGLALAARLRAGALSIVGVVAASWLVAYALSGPPFFAHRLSVMSRTEERAGSFVDNGVQRFEDWRRAVAIFEHWPLFLQAVAHGGLVLALPLFLLIGCVLVVSVHQTATALRAGDFMRPAA